MTSIDIQKRYFLVYQCIYLLFVSIFNFQFSTKIIQINADGVLITFGKTAARKRDNHVRVLCFVVVVEYI